MAGTFVIGAASGNRAQMARALAGQGITVVEAASADEVRARLKENEPPGAALVDLDGLGSQIEAVFQTLAEHDVSVVALTKTPDAVGRAGLPITPHVYRKPITRAAFDDLIRFLAEPGSWP